MHFKTVSSFYVKTFTVNIHCRGRLEQSYNYCIRITENRFEKHELFLLMLN